MRVLYFAWLRERLGRSEEEIAGTPATVAELIADLRRQSPRHAEALAETARIRCAVNQEFAPLDAPLAAGDEVALFPPVTGG